MALIIKDRIKEVTTTTGTGAISLGGTSATFEAFSSYMTNGDTAYYALVHTASGVDEWEVGIGTWNTGNTLTRTTVIAGTNDGSPVNFSSGIKDIFMTYPASIAAYTDGSGDLSADIGLGNHSTTELVEGSNLYYTDARVDAHLSGGTGVTYNSGAISIGQDVATTSNVTFNSVTVAGDPTSALQVATKEYVDTIAAAGIHYHVPVRVETPSALTATYNNGTAGVGATLTNSGTQAALSIDGVTLDAADRVLVYQQTNQAHNGIYTVTSTGSASTNWVLTRSTDTDSYGASDPDGLGEGDAFFVKEGATGAGELYVMNTSGAITFGTTPITFTVIAETAVYSAGTGLTLTGTTFAAEQDIATTASPTFNTVTASLVGNTSGTHTGAVVGNVTGNVTGNAGTATALATSRTIQLTGDVIGSATFNGTANATITATVQDDSHSHVISNVDGLQSALDAKADDTTTITAGNGLTGGGSIGVNRTISHADTSTQASLTALTGAAVVSDVDVDTYGHVTGLATRNMTLADLGYTGETNATADQTITAGAGLTGGGTGDVTLNHADTSSQASVNNAGATVIQDVTLDTYGHVTGLASTALTPATIGAATSAQGALADSATQPGDNISTLTNDAGYTTNVGDITGVTAGSGITGGGTSGTVTINHADTSSQASVNNSNGTVIQDITLDTYGHLTGINSVNLDGRYYTETEADSRFVNATGDTVTGALTIQNSLIIDENSNNGQIVYDLPSGTYIPRPRGAHLVNTASSQTGAITIKLPSEASSKSDMLSFWVDIYDYAGGASGESVSIYVYGYQYSSNLWTNTGAVVLSDRTDRDYTVRFGHNGTNHVVTIGETNSTWSYLQVSVRDFQAGYSSSYTYYDTDWDISVETSLPSTVSQTSTDNYPVTKQLKTARTIGLSGDLSGSASFDGSSNITITATVADDSHNHTIANVDGLQTALNSKLSTSGKAADSNLLDGLDLHTGRNNLANRVVRTNSSGYADFGWINTTSGNTTSTLTDIYVNTNDGYIRKATPAHFRSQITDGVYYPASNPNGYTTYTANQALNTTSNPTFNDVYVADQILHSGDTDTYMQFHAADQWRVVTGGVERLEVNNSQITSTAPIHAPSFHGDGSSLTNLPASPPANGSITSAKLSYLTRSFAGSIPRRNGTVNIAMNDNFAFYPVYSFGGNQVSMSFRSAGGFLFRNGNDDNDGSYSINWRYVT